MKSTLETRLGIFFALALGVAVLILEMIGGIEAFKPGYEINATFKTVYDLKRGDPVKIAGVQIGYVEQIELVDGFRARVTMKIDQRYKISTDAKAMIKFTGLMGQNFVSLEVDSATAAASAREQTGAQESVRAENAKSSEGDRIIQLAALGAAGAIGAAAPTLEQGGSVQTVEQPDLNALLRKLDNVAGGIEGLTKSFSPENFSTLLGPVNDFIKANSTNLSAILSNTANVTYQISSGQGTIGKLIYDDALYKEALGTVGALQVAANEAKTMMNQAQGIVTKAGSIVDQINSGQGTLGKLAKDETLYNETTMAMTQLREALTKINKGQGSVGRLINDDSLYRNAKLTLQKLDKATEGLEDQGPLSVLGIAVNSLF